MLPGSCSILVMRVEVRQAFDEHRGVRYRVKTGRRRGGIGGAPPSLESHRRRVAHLNHFHAFVSGTSVAIAKANGAMVHVKGAPKTFLEDSDETMLVGRAIIKTWCTLLFLQECIKMLWARGLVQPTPHRRFRSTDGGRLRHSRRGLLRSIDEGD